MNKLRQLLREKNCLSGIETSNGLSAIIANTQVQDREGQGQSFDLLWVSSLCDSIMRGKPDNEIVDFSQRLNTINEIMEVSSKPILLDCDTGGKREHFVDHVKTLERLGVSGVIIEDKTGVKCNSLVNESHLHELENPTIFAEKIRAGKEATKKDGLFIIARIESLIAQAGQKDALERGKLYIAAGADAIMIHSNRTEGKDIKSFIKELRKVDVNIPICVIPTTYNHITESEFACWGANIVIHANHLLRSAYPAMLKTAQAILKNGRSLEAEEENCISINECLQLIAGGEQVD